MLVRFYVGLGNRTCGGYIDAAIAVGDARAIELFGGFTRFNGTDGWLDKGEIYHEESLVYEVATKESLDIADFASYLKGIFDQQSILVIRIPCETEFVT